MEGVEALPSQDIPSQADFEKMAMSMTSELGVSSNQLKSIMSKEMYDAVIRIASNPAFQKSIDDSCASNGSYVGGSWVTKYVVPAVVAVLLIFTPPVDAGAAQAGMYRRAAQLRQQRLANRAPGSQQGGKKRRTKKHRARRHSRKH